jgi:hypothetical protein
VLYLGRQLVDSRIAGGELIGGLGLRQASVTGLWAALTSGARGGAVQPTGAGGDRALFRLIELHAYFRELGRPERRLLLALRVAAGEAAPADDRAGRAEERATGLAGIAAQRSRSATAARQDCAAS